MWDDIGFLQSMVIILSVLLLIMVIVILKFYFKTKSAEQLLVIERRYAKTLKNSLAVSNEFSRKLAKQRRGTVCLETQS